MEWAELPFMTHAAEHGIMVSKPCCHPESTLFVRTKDPGAPRNHSRVRCENANQRVWRASLTPPTTSCSNTGRTLRVRIKRTKYKDEAWRLLL